MSNQMENQNILDYLQETGQFDQMNAWQQELRELKTQIRGMWGTDKEGSKEYAAVMAKHEQVRKQALDVVRDYFVAIDDRVALSVLYVNDLAHFSTRERAARNRISRVYDTMQRAFDGGMVK